MIQLVEHLNAIQSKISDQTTSDVTETANATAGTTMVYADLVKLACYFYDQLQNLQLLKIVI